MNLQKVAKNAHSGGALHSYVTLCHTGGGCPARFWGAFLATFARHWYTGKRFLDEISERFLNTQKLPKTQIKEEHYTAMSHYVTLGDGAPRGGQMRGLSKGTERSVR